MPALWNTNLTSSNLKQERSLDTDTANEKEVSIFVRKILNLILRWELEKTNEWIKLIKLERLLRAEQVIRMLANYIPMKVESSASPEEKPGLMEAA